MKVVVTADQIVEADRYTIESLGIPGLELMETAARRCFQALEDLCEPSSHILVVVGGGNNGGDGLALARLLKLAGYEVLVYTLKHEAAFRGDAATNFDRLKAVGVTPRVLTSPNDLVIPPHVSWIVDAMLGTGLKGAARGLTAEIIECVNASKIPVLAIDLPSGLSGSHGRLPGPHIRAQKTITFQNLKLAHAISPACIACGEVAVYDIGIKYPEIAELNHYLCEPSDYGRRPRPADSHKGRYGTLGVLGGFKGMAGAAMLAGHAALRFGAGKVKVFGDGAQMIQQPYSLMTGRLEDLDQHSFDAWVIGPGLSRDPAIWDQVAAYNWQDKPTVWDADGLYFIKEQGMVQGQPWVMTPHPGEAAYLLGVDAAAVQADRLAAIRSLGELFPSGWIVLKGYRTLVLSPEKELFIIGAGNPALATAGTGDVLAGMIGALLASGLPPDEAVLLSCLRHGMAADRWVHHYTDHSMLAEDIIEDLKYKPGGS